MLSHLSVLITYIYWSYIKSPLFKHPSLFFIGLYWFNNIEYILPHLQLLLHSSFGKFLRYGRIPKLSLEAVNCFICVTFRSKWPASFPQHHQTSVGDHHHPWFHFVCDGLLTAPLILSGKCSLCPM